MRIDIVTIFPDYFGPVDSDGRVGASGPLGVSLIGKAGVRGDIDFRVHDLRRWTSDIHHTVDDTPFGGGPGMVMKPDVWGEALDAVLAGPGAPAVTEEGGSAVTEEGAAVAGAGGSAVTAEGAAVAGAGGSAVSGAGGSAVTGVGGSARLVVPAPSGTPFTQELAAAYAAESHLVFACGRYEGIDSRVVADARTRMVVDEVSIGDYVLAGGEAAVAVIVEAVCRLLPGVLGNEQSAADDSFGGAGGAMSGLLEGPVYTRPRSWRGLEVPDVLLSGHHGAISRWQRDEALRRTAASRPDLIRRLASAAGGLDKRDRQVLAEAGFPVDGESMAH
ncbi:MAG: tRNA ((37)-N1)-methyltransferase TrmD [Actinomycetia bacterium]|nr:tRNA ((37)-N1)-methyltransferase TrmD [Actinomycetes bacterium]